MKFNLPKGPDLSREALKRVEAGHVDDADILTIVWTTVRNLWDKPSIILWTSFLFLLLWGFHGNLETIIKFTGETWIHRITGGLAWGKTLVSFISGFILVVIFPCLLIRFKFHMSLREFGLGWPNTQNRKKAVQAFLTLFLISAVFIVIASFDSSMQKEYPLFRQWHDGVLVYDITNGWEFVFYELIYLLFFITIEFIFRGYLLFGLHAITVHSTRTGNHHPPVLRFGIYAILIQMLAYTTWHYGKPVPEILGTIVWGVGVAAVALRIRSLWPVIFAHWLYNVLLDLILWKGWYENLQTIFVPFGSK